MSWDRFVLEIQLGNDSMKSRQDVAYSLREVAARLERGSVDGKIMDVNGNIVGDFNFKSKHEDKR